MTETPLFFNRGSWQLYGVYHASDGGSVRTPFVFCHPFGEEKLWTHRVFVRFARELASRGHPVLRFDYGGNGDSGGLFEESSIETARADIDAAIDTLLQYAPAPRVGLMGMRLGASLACLAAVSRGDVETLALWAPIVDGKRYLQDLLRINVTTQVAVYREVRADREAMLKTLAAGGRVNIDGYEITREMSDQLHSLALIESIERPSCRSLIVQIERSKTAKVARELESLRDRLGRADLFIVDEEPFWKETLRFYEMAPNLFATTLTWLGHQ